MKAKAAVLTSALLFLAGCHSYSGLSVLGKDRFYEDALNKTVSVQLLNSLETKAKISATHLNPLMPEKFSEGESFFVGVYIPDDYDKVESTGLFNAQFNLFLKGEKGELLKPQKIEPIKKREDSEIYKKMPLTDAWSRYYIVTFKKAESDKKAPITLVFEGASLKRELIFEAAR